MQFIPWLVGASLLCIPAGDPAPEASVQGNLISISVPMPGALLPKTGGQLPSAGRGQQWLPIPEWLAGTWRSRSQTLLYSYDCQLHVNDLREPVTISTDRLSIWGLQKDSSGQIWHYVGTPCFRVINTSKYLKRQQIQDMLLIENTADSITVRSLAAVTCVDRSTNEVADTFIEETTTTYEFVEDGKTKVTFLIDDYDLEGHPKTSSRSVCMDYRVKPFQAIDQDERGNLHELFIDFQKHRATDNP